MLRRDAKQPRGEVVVMPLPAADAALDAVAAILRALAKHLASSPGTASRLERWARHLLLLVPPPSRPEAPQPAERDWDGLRRDVVRHIRDEGAAAARTVGDLQEALWAVVEGLSEALALDAGGDRDALRCIERLREAAERRSGELRRAALEAAAELRSLIEARNERYRELALALGKRVDALQDELADARRAASMDQLTELANRSVLEPALVRAIHVHRLTGEPHALLLADVDGFKSVNDTFGHVAGDQVLRSIADTLAVSFPRRSDLVCRFGGDEFAVLLREASPDDAERLAARFVELVRDRAIEAGGEQIRVTVSVGLAAARADDDAATWLARADRALYEAKAQGRDRVAGPGSAEAAA